MPPRANLPESLPGEITFRRGEHGLTDSGAWWMRSWLDANSVGAFASSSLGDVHTRKYHGLLVAAPEGMGKHVFLSRLDACWIRPDGAEVPLYTNLHPGAVWPKGVDDLVSFQQGLCPRWHWSHGPFELTRSLAMHGSLPAVLFRYEALGEGHLRLIPRFAFRDMHHLTRENPWLQGHETRTAHGSLFHPYQGLPNLHLSFSVPAPFTPHFHWIKQIHLFREAERGFEAHEDLATPGHYDLKIQAGEPIYVAASLSRGLSELNKVWADEMARRQFEWDRCQKGAVDTAHGHLRYHGRQFLVHSDGHDGICAGYPWFGQWGRDAMISLPGLTIGSNRSEAALAILKDFARARKDGLIPNYLNADGNHAYNSVDASLWFFRTVQMYLDQTGDTRGVLDHLAPAMVDILSTFSAGRARHVRVTDTGFLWVGNAHTQLTWMDAEVFGKPVTPRHGMAVELNALWYNALVFVEALLTKDGQPFPAELKARIPSLAAHFTDVFAGGPWPWLADTVHEGGADYSLRPNQVFAAALPHSPLPLETRRRLLAAVAEHLVTPYGLRTLSPRDPRYRGRYEGDGPARDSAYHQGTVWPWLVGAYVDASLAVAEDRPRRARELLETFAPLWSEGPRHYGVGGLAEIYDGDAPHRPAGCISQAWSVAEVIRARMALAAAK